MWGIFVAYNIECSDIYGKEFFNHAECCEESRKSNIETDVRCHSAISQQSGRNQWPGQNSVWEEFLDTSVTNEGWSGHQSSKHKSLCILRFCVVSRQSSSTSWTQRRLEEQSCRSTSRDEFQRYDAVNGESTEFEWNIFPGFTTLQLCGKINDVLSSLGQTPEPFAGRVLFMSLFNDISCSIVQRSILQAKGEESSRYIPTADELTIETMFRIFFLSISSVSTEQWQLYAMNVKATKIARGNPLFWLDSHLFLAKSKPKVPAHDEEATEDQTFLQQYFQQVERKQIE